MLWKGRVYREVDVTRMRTHIDEMSFYSSSSLSVWWINVCSMLFCFIIYVDVAGILVLMAHVKFYFFNMHGRNDLCYWDIKRTKLSSILALAFVRHILSFLANVAPDFSVLFLFICQRGLSILKILGEKELRQLKNDFIQYCCPPQ